MGRSKPQASMSPIMPTENVGLVSGFMRKPKRQGRRMRRGGREERGSRRDISYGRVTQPDGSTTVQRAPRPRFKNEQVGIGDSMRDQIRREGPRRGPVGRRMPPRRFEPDFMSGPKQPRPLTGGYDPKSGVRYTDTGVPTAVQGTERVPVQDPTLGGPPEREVPMPRERRQRITRESDPRGAAPFSPDEKGIARDRFFERMFDKAEQKKQQKSIRKEERGRINQSMRDERNMRRNEPGEIDVGGEIDINAERGGRRRRGGGMKRRGDGMKKRRGGMKRRGGKRRDFTRKRSQMEGGRRGRSREERAAFRDRYVSRLR